MIHSREGFRIVVLEPAKSWIQQDCCGGCGKPKKEWMRRTDWRNCSVECTAKFNESSVYFGWPDVRKKVFERDNFTCRTCGFRSEKIMLNNYSELDADHIIPISLGGDEWSLDNIQTLCKKCHKEKTVQDMKKISVERRILPGQTRLV